MAFGLLARLWLGEDSAAGSDDGVCGDDKSVPLDACQLFPRKAQRMIARRLVGAGGFVDIRGDDLVGLDADLLQKLKPSSAGRSQDYLKRNVIRPLVRS